MPYICKLLFPETTCLGRGLPMQDPDGEVERAGRLARLSLAEFAEEVRRRGVLRLTCNPDALRELSNLRLQFETEFNAPVNINWVDVALFPQEVGFLILKVELAEPQPTTDQLNDFLYHLRFVHPPKIGWRLANWKLEGSPQTPAFNNQDLIEFLLQGIAADSILQFPTLAAYLNRQSESGVSPHLKTTASEEGQVFGQTFRQYSYVCLAGSPVDQTSGVNPQAEQISLAGNEQEEPIFNSPEQRVIYELATCSQTSLPDYRPHPQALQQIMENGRIALWTNWEGLALHDNIVFVGRISTGFTRRDLPHNVEHDYFYLYLLTLYQKVRLSLFAGELMRDSASLYRNLKEARALTEDFLELRNNYWFANVTFKPQGMIIYQQFQRGMEVKALYESVSKEVSELQAHYETRAERRRDALLFFLTFVGLPAGLLSQVFGGILFSASVPDSSPQVWSVKINGGAWAALGIVSLVVYALSALIYFLWRFSGRKPARRNA